MTDDTTTVRVVHPRTLEDKLPPAYVDVDGESVPTDVDGAFDVPIEAAGWIRELAETYGVDPEALCDTCLVEKSDGEVCGRDLPCQYHTDDEES